MKVLISTHGFDGRLFEHYTGMIKRIPELGILEYLFLSFRDIFFGNDAVDGTSKFDKITANNVAPMDSQSFKLLRAPLRNRNIIRIHPSDYVTLTSG